MKSRFLFIGMCGILMLGIVYIIGTTLYEEGKTATSTTLTSNASSSIPVERGTFIRSGQALSYQQMPESKRNLNTYYKNRAYPGAPPTIPHALISEKGIGGKNCLQCHQNGGYAAQFKAYAPVTPHPELLNCNQCHVPQKSEMNFKSSSWEKITTVEMGQVALPGGPPIIPHSLEMRNNCLSCHAGPAAPKEIRVSHPERINCRQCHVPKNSLQIFQKPNMEDATFQRPDKPIGYSEKALIESEISQISDWIQNENQQ